MGEQGRDGPRRQGQSREIEIVEGELEQRTGAGLPQELHLTGDVAGLDCWRRRRGADRDRWPSTLDDQDWQRRALNDSGVIVEREILGKREAAEIRIARGADRVHEREVGRVWGDSLIRAPSRSQPSQPR